MTSATLAVLAQVFEKVPAEPLSKETSPTKFKHVEKVPAEPLSKETSSTMFNLTQVLWGSDWRVAMASRWKTSEFLDSIICQLESALLLKHNIWRQR